jgi:hypothetical protein
MCAVCDMDETVLTGTMWCRFVGIGGPYHIADHYVHESSRGVENLSAMKPAMGGIPNFAHHSPTALLDEVELQPGALPPTYLLHGARSLFHCSPTYPRGIEPAVLTHCFVSAFRHC